MHDHLAVFVSSLIFRRSVNHDSVSQRHRLPRVPISNWLSSTETCPSDHRGAECAKKISSLPISPLRRDFSCPDRLVLSMTLIAYSCLVSLWTPRCTCAIRHNPDTGDSQFITRHVLSGRSIKHGFQKGLSGPGRLHLTLTPSSFVPCLLEVVWSNGRVLLGEALEWPRSEAIV